MSAAAASSPPFDAESDAEAYTTDEFDSVSSGSSVGPSRSVSPVHASAREAQARSGAMPPPLPPTSAFQPHAASESSRAAPARPAVALLASTPIVVSNASPADPLPTNVSALMQSKFTALFAALHDYGRERIDQVASNVAQQIRAESRERSVQPVNRGRSRRTKPLHSSMQQTAVAASSAAPAFARYSTPQPAPSARSASAEWSRSASVLSPSHGIAFGSTVHRDGEARANSLLRAAPLSPPHRRASFDWAALPPWIDRQSAAVAPTLAQTQPPLGSPNDDFYLLSKARIQERQQRMAALRRRVRAEEDEQHRADPAPRRRGAKITVAARMRTAAQQTASLARIQRQSARPLNDITLQASSSLAPSDVTSRQLNFAGWDAISPFDSAEASSSDAPPRASLNPAEWLARLDAMERELDAIVKHFLAQHALEADDMRMRSTRSPAADSPEAAVRFRERMRALEDKKGWIVAERKLILAKQQLLAAQLANGVANDSPVRAAADSHAPTSASLSILPSVSAPSALSRAPPSVPEITEPVAVVSEIRISDAVAQPSRRKTRKIKPIKQEDEVRAAAAPVIASLADAAEAVSPPVASAASATSVDPRSSANGRAESPERIAAEPSLALTAIVDARAALEREREEFVQEQAQSRAELALEAKRLREAEDRIRTEDKRLDAKRKADAAFVATEIARTGTMRKEAEIALSRIEQSAAAQEQAVEAAMLVAQQLAEDNTRRSEQLQQEAEAQSEEAERRLTALTAEQREKAEAESRRLDQLEAELRAAVADESAQLQKEREEWQREKESSVQSALEATRQAQAEKFRVELALTAAGQELDRARIHQQQLLTVEALRVEKETRQRVEAELTVAFEMRKLELESEAQRQRDALKTQLEELAAKHKLASDESELKMRVLLEARAAEHAELEAAKADLQAEVARRREAEVALSSVPASPAPAAPARLPHGILTSAGGKGVSPEKQLAFAHRRENTLGAHTLSIDASNDEASPTADRAALNRSPMKRHNRKKSKQVGAAGSASPGGISDHLQVETTKPSHTVVVSSPPAHIPSWRDPNTELFSPPLVSPRPSDAAHLILSSPSFSPPGNRLDTTPEPMHAVGSKKPPPHRFSVNRETSLPTTLSAARPELPASSSVPRRKLTAHCMDSEDDDSARACHARSFLALPPPQAIACTDDDCTIIFPTEEEVIAMLAAEANGQGDPSAHAFLMQGGTDAEAVSDADSQAPPSGSASPASALAVPRPSTLAPPSHTDLASAAEDLPTARAKRRQKLKRRLTCSKKSNANDESLGTSAGPSETGSANCNEDAPPLLWSASLPTSPMQFLKTMQPPSTDATDSTPAFRSLPSGALSHLTVSLTADGSSATPAASSPRPRSFSDLLPVTPTAAQRAAARDDEAKEDGVASSTTASAAVPASSTASTDRSPTLSPQATARVLSSASDARSPPGPSSPLPVETTEKLPLSPQTNSPPTDSEHCLACIWEKKRALQGPRSKLRSPNRPAHSRDCAP